MLALAASHRYIAGSSRLVHVVMGTTLYHRRAVGEAVGSLNAYVECTDRLLCKCALNPGKVPDLTRWAYTLHLQGHPLVS